MIERFQNNSMIALGVTIHLDQSVHEFSTQGIQMGKAYQVCKIGVFFANGGLVAVLAFFIALSSVRNAYEIDLIIAVSFLLSLEIAPTGRNCHPALLLHHLYQC